MCEKELKVSEEAKVVEKTNWNSINNDVNEVLQNNNIINWSLLASKIFDELKEELEKLEKKPSLKIILVGEKPSSLVYVNQKKKKAEYIWMDYEKISFDDNITEKELLIEIEKLNNDEKTDWFMVQLPLPKHIDERKVIDSINPKKDVDWFHPENQWKINLLDDSWFQPCTPVWILELLESIDVNVVWKIVTVIWKSNIVWTPISIMLSKMWATVVNCDLNTPDIYKFTKDSDIVISATWVIWLINAEHIKKDSVVIDVWITRGADGKIYWDCDFDSIIKTWAKITPVPGWVWPMTVAMLMKNTLKAYKNKNK